MAERKWAVASAEVFDVAHGDPLMTDRGFSRLDIMRKELTNGTIECFLNGARKLEFLDDLGMSIRPYITPVNMRLSQYTATPSGSWDEIQSVGGTKDVYHLRYSDALGTAWNLTSNYNIAANPVFAVSLIIPETRNNWDFTNNEPYIRITFGNGKWSVLLSKQYGSFLQVNVAGFWQVAADLKGGDGRIARALTDEKWVTIRCEFGAIMVSLDMGFSWEIFIANDGMPINVPAGPFAISGQGSAPIIGLGEVVPAVASYKGPAWDSFDVRTAGTDAIITGRSIIPAAGGSLTFSDISDPEARIGQYEATFTPVQIQTFPFRMWNSPLLQNVTFRYPFERITTTNVFSTPWDQYITDVDVKKPEKLSEGTCSITLQLPAHTYDPTMFDGIRYRKVRVKLGYKMDDNTVEWETVYTGYVDDLTLTWDNFGSIIAQVSLINIAGLLKTKFWRPLDSGAFAGMTPQAVGNFIVKSEGFMDEDELDSTYVAWFTVSTGTQPLPLGEWDHPFETIKPGENKFATLERIFDYYGFEIAVDNDGVLVALPKNWLNAANPHTLYVADPAMLDDIRKQISSMSTHFNIKDSASMVMLYGRLENGQTAIMYAVDDPAEIDATSERFTPFRNMILEEFSSAHGRPDEALMLEKLNNVSRDNLGYKKEPQISFPADIRRSRRDLITVIGAGQLKIPDNTQLALMSQSLKFTKQQGLGEITNNCAMKIIFNQVT